MQGLHRRGCPQRRAGFLDFVACSRSRQNRARQVVRRVGLRRDAVWQAQFERCFQPRQQFHALQAAEAQVAVELRSSTEHRQSASAAQFLEQTTDHFQYAFAYARAVELSDGSGHRTHEGFCFFSERLPRPNADCHPRAIELGSRSGHRTHEGIRLLPREATTPQRGLIFSRHENLLNALSFATCAAEKPFGISVVERSTPERSAPVKSVSLKIATPISAPENLAPFTFAKRRFTFRRRARWKFTFERSQRKNSTPLACASVKSAPGRIASVMSVLRRSAFRRFAAERSAPGSLAPRRSVPSRFALRRIAPLRFAPLRSMRESSASVRSARAPPSLPRKKRSCASRISARVLPLCLMLFGFLSPIVLPQPAISASYFTGSGGRNSTRFMTS